MSDPCVLNSTDLAQMIPVDGGIVSSFVSGLLLLLVGIVLFSAQLRFCYLPPRGKLGRLAVEGDEEQDNEERRLIARRVSIVPDDDDDDGEQRWDPEWFRWLLDLWRTRDEDVEIHGGQQALLFVRFQRILNWLLLFCTVVTIGMVLPVNWSGDRGLKGFSRTTLVNIQPSSPALWAHAVGMLLITVAFYVAADQFSRHVPLAKRHSSNVVMVLNLQDASCERMSRALTEYTTRHLRLKSLSHVEVIPTLRGVISATDDLAAAKKRAREYSSNSRSRLGRLFDWLACRDTSMSTLVAREQGARSMVHQQWHLAEESNSGAAFLTFSTVADANTFLQLHDKVATADQRQLQGDLVVGDWTARIAPPPSTVNWSNLAVTPASHFLRKLVLNGLLFAFVALWSTPTSFLTTGWHKIGGDLVPTNNYFVTTFVTPFLTLILGYIMPIVIVTTSSYERHRTAHAEALSNLFKVFVYSLLVGFVLPALVLTTLEALIHMTAEQFQHTLVCVFLPGNGLFFVNLMLSYGLVGTALQLMPILTSIRFFFLLFNASTPEAREAARRPRTAPLSFGMAFASHLGHLMPVVAYATDIPLVVPAALIFNFLSYHLTRVTVVKTARRANQVPDARIGVFVVNVLLGMPLIGQGLLAGYVGVRVGDQIALWVFLLCLPAFTVLVLLLRWKKWLRFADNEARSRRPFTLEVLYEDTAYIPSVVSKYRAWKVAHAAESQQPEDESIRLFCQQ